MAENDAAVWERVVASMPLHDCGTRLLPGGTEDTGPMLVCTACSYFAAVPWEWVDARVDEARAAIAEESTRGR